MSYASISGRAKTDPKNPRAFGFCDRDGFLYNLEDLVWQHEWRGNELVNIHLRVCKRCLDVPFENDRPLYLPPDPPPVEQPRAGSMAVQENEGSETWDGAGVTWDSGEEWQ